MANIIDVANRANVSIATVSRVINHSGYVSSATREKVMQAIAELEFSPSVLGKNLLSRKTNIIAVYVHNLVNPFYTQLLNALELELRSHQYFTLVLSGCNEDPHREQYLALLNGGRVDGLILISDAQLDDLMTKELPVVSLDRHFAHTPWVASDNYEGGRLAAKHFMERGCKRVAFIGDDAMRLESLTSEVSRRKDGFVDQLQHYPHMTSKIIEYPKGTSDDLIDHYLTQLVRDETIDGVFCISDVLAFRLLGVAKRLNRPVPQQFKVIGYDGVTPAFHTSFRLTSIVQPLPQLANALVDTLFGRISGQDTKRNQRLTVFIRQGDST